MAEVDAATLGVILSPGAFEAVSIQFASRFPRGPWRADLKVSDGTLARSSIATISFPGRHVFPTSNPIVPLVTLFAFVLALVLLRRRRSLAKLSRAS
jgi:hypothetical protein